MATRLLVDAAIAPAALAAALPALTAFAPTPLSFTFSARILPHGQQQLDFVISHGRLRLIPGDRFFF